MQLSKMNLFTFDGAIIIQNDELHIMQLLTQETDLV